MTTPNSTPGFASILGKLGNLLNLIIANAKWGVILIAIIAATSVVTTYKNNGVWEGKYKAYRDSAQAVATIWMDSVRREVSNARYEAETYKNVANIQTAELNRLRTANAILSTSNKELNRTLDSLIILLGPLNPIVCETCLLLRDSLNFEIANLNRQIAIFDNRDSTRLLEISALNRMASLERIIGDSLRTVILHMPIPKPAPHLFGLFQINPNQAFVI